MKIRLLQPITINGYQFKVGQILDVHFKAAQKYIKHGNAESADLIAEPVAEVKEIKETKKKKSDAYQVQESVQDTQDNS